MIGPLSDPAAYGGDPRQAFHLVIPTLPGFGFSAKPDRDRMDIPRIARAWIVLMERLGYQRWGAQGGDLGCAVTDEIATIQPAGFIGSHLNFAMFPPTPDEIENATPAERAALGRRERLLGQPLRLRQGAADPAADDRVLAGRLTRRARRLDLRDVPGHLRHPRQRRRLLHPGRDARRHHAVLAAQLRHKRRPPLLGDEPVRAGHRPPRIDNPIVTPVGFTMPPKEAVRKSRRQLERRYANIVYFNEPAEGGHFFALEQPQTLIDDIRATFAPAPLNRIGGALRRLMSIGSSSSPRVDR